MVVLVAENIFIFKNENCKADLIGIILAVVHTPGHLNGKN